MDYLSLFVLITYLICLVFISVYCLGILQLTINFSRAKKKKNIQQSTTNELPKVTVQLPLYNEPLVAERLLDAVAAMNYPNDKFEIQVLDDSTDETQEILQRKVENLRKTGVDIVYLHRDNRKGFKAGALKEGLAKAKGEFLAIFDSDFIPEKDWLKRVMPNFNDETGMVQTRWTHLNKGYSSLTKLQAFALDAHFTLEHLGRHLKGHLINFNGTAGVWRKQCILDAGNWQSDTLTEDLDLSFRAQLKGWEFKYCFDIEAAAELPAYVAAARSQQFRWNKGGAQNLVKHTRGILTNPSLSFWDKFHGLIHLCSSSMYLAVFILAMLSLPILWIKSYYIQFHWMYDLFSFFVLSSLILFFCYWQSFKYLYGSGFKSFFKYSFEFLRFYALILGFSYNNSSAVFQGLNGKTSDFVRTPKFSFINDNSEAKGRRKRLLHDLNIQLPWVESFLFLYFAFAIVSSFLLLEFALLPFHILLFIGFGYYLFRSIWQ